MRRGRGLVPCEGVRIDLRFEQEWSRDLDVRRICERAGFREFLISLASQLRAEFSADISRIAYLNRRGLGLVQ